MNQLIEYIKHGDWTSAGLTVLAGLGGLLAYAVKTQEKAEPFLWRKALVQFASSAFVGYLIYGVCLHLGVDGLLLGPICGVFGWLGATATFQVIKRFAFDKLGISEDKKP